MLEQAEVGARVAKQEFEAEARKLRVDLLNAQFDLRNADFPVLVLIAGDDREGTNAVIDLFAEWMDTRYIETRFYGQATEEEIQRPRFWRYWIGLPHRGQIAVHLGAWALSAIADRVTGVATKKEFRKRIDRIRQFEQTLTDDGLLILKFWLHLPKRDFRKRLKKAKRREDAALRVEERDWEIYQVYDEVMPVVEELLAATHRPAAPWHVVESTDRRHRDLSIARALLAAVQKRLADPESSSAHVAASAPDEAASEPLEIPAALDRVDLSASLEYEEYREKVSALQARLRRLSLKARQAGVSAVLAFEGWDAAGKGGAIRRLTRAMDARGYRVIPVAAPTEEEKARHYLWRFWRQLPRAGRMLIFDRTWYGRVLVERVEGFASTAEWQRAYGEIRDFEEQLAAHGMVVLKFWLHIHPDEQLRRFQSREKMSYKKYKITDEDYRNRKRWPEYTRAVNEMVARTHTEESPWHLVSANDKRWARVYVLRTVCRALEDRALLAARCPERQEVRGVRQRCPRHRSWRKIARCTNERLRTSRWRSPWSPGCPPTAGAWGSWPGTPSARRRISGAHGGRVAPTPEGLLPAVPRRTREPVGGRVDGIPRNS